MGAQWTKEEDAALIAFVKESDEKEMGRYETAMAYSRHVGRYSRGVSAYHSRMGLLARAGLIPLLGVNRRRNRKKPEDAVCALRAVLADTTLTPKQTLQKVREVLLYA